MKRKVSGIGISMLVCIACLFTFGCNPDENNVDVVDQSAEVQLILDNIIEDYNNGIYGVDEASRRIEKVGNENPQTYQIVDGARDDLALISESKSAYAQAEQCMSEGNFLLAYKLFGQIYSADTFYANSQERRNQAKGYHIEKVKNEAADLVSRGEYQGAVAILKTCKDDFDGTTELDSLISAYQEYEKSKEILAIVTEVDDKILENDYKTALNILSDALSKHTGNETLLTKRADCEEKYVIYVLDSAKQCYNNGYDFAGAIAIINAAIVDLPNNIELDKAKAEYMTCKPTELYELTTFYQEGGRDLRYRQKQISDNRGDIHNEYYEVSDGYRPVTFVYLIDGKYDMISGTAFVSESLKNYEDIGQIKIYGDGILLYESIMLGKGILPIKFSAELSGVTEMRIEIIKGVVWQYYPYLSNVQLYKKLG